MFSCSRFRQEFILAFKVAKIAALCAQTVVFKPFLKIICLDESLSWKKEERKKTCALTESSDRQTLTSGKKTYQIRNYSHFRQEFTKCAALKRATEVRHLPHLWPLCKRVRNHTHLRGNRHTSKSSGLPTSQRVKLTNENINLSPTLIIARTLML